MHQCYTSMTRIRLQVDSIVTILWGSYFLKDQIERRRRKCNTAIYLKCYLLSPDSRCHKSAIYFFVP